MSNINDRVQIAVRPVTLTDGSKVFNVLFNGIELEAITENDAYDLAQDLTALINKHTNTEVDYRGTI